MADLQQILGTMLATGMGGRSGRSADHIGGVLGGSGMMGMGARSGGSGFKQTAGLAALGYLAYRAFQERQRNQAASGGGTPRPGGSPWGGVQGSQTGTSSGGILGSIFGAGSASGGGSLAERLSGILQTRTTQAPAAGRDEGAFPELAMEDQQALLLIRAMITAANADGVISPDERQSVLSALDEAGAGAEERRIVEQELNNPQPVDALLRQVRDPQTAEQVYMASVMAVAAQSEAERSYLQYLAARLNIDPQRLQQIRGAA
ncbi:MAG TPA: tellurite resistance TerB family protein [Azospirillum sp.]|nr:tellurite resistance TerB family protein [Azospirillum sp.]